MTLVSPRIGISACILHEDPERDVYNGRPLLYIEQSTANWLLEAGVRPYIIPFASQEASPRAELEELVAGLDGLVLHGGADMAPSSYGEAPICEKWPGDPVRDAYELELVHAALALDKPVLGVCRGHQVLNVALGGTLYQDIATQVPEALPHTDSELYDRNQHSVRLLHGTRLADLYPDTERGLVNSVHHQAVKDLGDGLVVEARSEPDGIIEAIRLDAGPDGPWAAGIQWHPEFQGPSDTALLDRFAVLEDFLGAVGERVG